MILQDLFGKPNCRVCLWSRSLSTLVQTHRLFDLPTFEVSAVYLRNKLF
ncbi:hypothetical protein RBEAN4_0731 [Rickettsia bellii str. RML An4]|uniref:Uncharacterized protein n=1 Tax=Rickettsia bellii str. RML An4 TaxID=1359193 RepID=A0A0F3QC66_RICBE|nr:hypothetical protein RBEAN4_0731 [Rickettsia bellii str. RML An4]